MAKLIARSVGLDGLQSFGEFAWDDWIRPRVLRPESIQPAELRAAAWSMPMHRAKAC